MSAQIAGRGGDQAAVDPLGRLIVLIDELVTRLAGENQQIDLLETTGSGGYILTSFNGITNGGDLTLGSPGGAGNKIKALAVYNGSGQAFTAAVLKDGTSTLDAITLGMTTLANGAYATWTPPGGVLESKIGAWKLAVTCAGSPTMSGIKVLVVLEE